MVLVSLLTGCVGGAWRTAQREDSIAAYYRFLRDHPDSKYEEEAEMRLAYHKLARDPSVEGFVAFRDAHPGSAMVSQLRTLIEEPAFAAAQADGSVEAFEGFAEEFAGGELAMRARGNAAYLGAGGFGGDLDALQAFAAEHPSSDFAAEAGRSAGLSDLRANTRVKRVALRVEVPASTSEADRVRRSFVDAARKAYASSSIALVPYREGDDSVDALLRIRHSEQQTQAARNGQNLSALAMEASTLVTLESPNRDNPSWQREFTLRVDARDHSEGRSMLYQPRSVTYWNEFFVPIASWASDAALRTPMAFDEPATGVDALGDRAVVAFADGSFRVIRLADPLQPAQIAAYRPSARLESRDGVRIVGDRIVMFGEDGIQAVSFGESGPEVVFEVGRGTVGHVRAVEAQGEDFVAAGSQGLVWVKGDGSGTRRLMSRRMRGVAAQGGMLIATDGASLYAATARQFTEGRVTSQIRVPVGFEARRVRTFGRTAIVLGDGGALIVDYGQPSRPRILHQLYSSTLGPVADAARVGSRVFLLGPRGLLVLAPGLNRVEEVLDVHPDRGLVAMGRHLVALDEDALQVVDTSPYAKRGRRTRAASPRPERANPWSSPPASSLLSEPENQPSAEAAAPVPAPAASAPSRPEASRPMNGTATRAAPAAPAASSGAERVAEEGEVEGWQIR